MDDGVGLSRSTGVRQPECVTKGEGGRRCGWGRVDEGRRRLGLEGVGPAFAHSHAWKIAVRTSFRTAWRHHQGVLPLPTD